MLDITQLNSLAVNFDLRVLASHKCQTAVFVVTDQIAGLVKTPSSSRLARPIAAHQQEWGVLNEACSGLRLVVQITSANQRSFKQQLSYLSNRHQTCFILTVHDPGVNAQASTNATKL